MINDHPEIADIVDAASRLSGHAIRTPLLECAAASELTGGRILVKPEMLQVTGSFKFRGAFNFISRLSEEERRRGIVAFSSGNHAQAVAAVSRHFAAAATIVMPRDAPAIKVEATRSFGAEIILYDRKEESREDIARELMESSGATLVPPFDHALTIAGQGTVGLEIAEDLALAGATPDQVLVPCSGGGLIAGIATAIKARFPDCRIFAVEPEGYDDTGRSLAAGSRQSVDIAAESICDALLVPTPGELTFSINSDLLAGGIAVPDETTYRAMAFAFRHLKLVAEPGGAIALGAVLDSSVDCRDRTTVVVMSGGNVDASIMREALSASV